MRWVGKTSEADGMQFRWTRIHVSRIAPLLPFRGSTALVVVRDRLLAGSRLEALCNFLRNDLNYFILLCISFSLYLLLGMHLCTSATSVFYKFLLFLQPLPLPFSPYSRLFIFIFLFLFLFIPYTLGHVLGIPSHPCWCTGFETSTLLEFLRNCYRSFCIRVYL